MIDKIREKIAELDEEIQDLKDEIEEAEAKKALWEELLEDVKEEGKPDCDNIVAEEMPVAINEVREISYGAQ